MKQAEDNRTIDFLGEVKRRGRPAKYSSSAEKQAAYRARRNVRQLSVELPEDLHQALSAYMKRQAMDGEVFTQSQVIEKLLRTQLLRKR
jgi:hypothetical protein